MGGWSVPPGVDGTPGWGILGVDVVPETVCAVVDVESGGEVREGEVGPLVRLSCKQRDLSCECFPLMFLSCSVSVFTLAVFGERNAALLYLLCHY